MKLHALLLFVLVASPVLAADDDCVALPDDRGGSDLDFELRGGSDVGLFGARWMGSGEVVDWIPELNIGLFHTPGWTDDLVDALADDMTSSQNRGDLAVDGYECKHAEPHELFEDPEGVQRAMGSTVPIVSRSQFLTQPAATITNIPAATTSFTGSGVTVAVLDTGLVPGNAELAAAELSGLSAVHLDPVPVPLGDGFDSDGDGNVDEAYWHATHVAGLVHLAAPDARLLSIRVLDDDGKGTSMDVARGVVQAVQAGVQIINMSLGLPHDTRAVEKAIEYAEAHGVVVVAAGGNRGLSCLDVPARMPGVIGVTAVDDSLVKPTWASSGTQAALSAPAVATISTRDGADWSQWDGSSFGTPLVTGAAALLKQRFPGIAPDDLKATLQLLVQPDANDATLQGMMGTGVLDLGNIATVEVAGTLHLRRDRGDDSLRWSPVPGNAPVDVARGLVSRLALGPSDDGVTTVELGDLHCIADSVPSGTTISDPDSPPPGDAFFYVLRDDPSGPGSGAWGCGSGNRERVEASTDCLSD